MMNRQTSEPALAELPSIARHRSAISGWGVYATQAIAEDTPIVEYKGQLVTQAEAWRREQRYLPRKRIWIFTIDDRLARDAAVGGNIARYVNHACNELLPTWSAGPSGFWRRAGSDKARN